MSSIVISGDTSGAITLAAPAVSGTNTATLPAATGTVMVSGNMPAFSVNANGTQSIVSGTSTLVSFGTIGTTGFDTNSNFNTGTYKFQPTVAGYYQINAATQFQGTSNPTNTYTTYIYKNGSAFVQASVSAVQYVLSNVSTVIYFNGSTDNVQVYAQHFTGTNQTILGTIFSGCLLRTS